MNPGGVFQLTGDDNHFRIVLSAPQNGRVLVCNWSDRDKWPDSPCLIDERDHEWVTKPSAIPFRFLTTVPYAGFATAMAAGGIRVSTFPITDGKLLDICQAILAATSVPEKLKRYLR